MSNPTPVPDTSAAAGRGGRATPGSDLRHDGDAQAALLERAIARVRAGDVEALHYLYVRYADSVCGYVQSIVRNRDDAEDVTQNVFAKLLVAIHKYERREVPFAAWILRVARNAALDHVRARRLVPCEEVRTSDDGYEHAELERGHSLREALAQLPSEQREVLVLRHVAGLSPGEIATRLDKTEGAVHGLHHRGRAALQRTLRDLEAAPVIVPAA